MHTDRAAALNDMGSEGHFVVHVVQFAHGKTAEATEEVVKLSAFLGIATRLGGPGGTRTPNQTVMSGRL